jgi:hypothetical protein
VRGIVGGVLLIVLGSVPVLAQQDVSGPDCDAPGVQCGDPLPARTGGQHEPDRFELTVLGGVAGGGELGEGGASLLTNEVPTGGTTSLFTTRARIDAAPVVEGRFGVRLSRRLWIEAGAAYSHPTFAVDIAADIEGAPDVTALATLTQLVADAGLQYRWNGRRFQPFVMGGTGYLRQLDEPRTTADTGWVAYGGGGMLMRVSTRPDGFLRHLAFRGDVRVLWFRDGIILTDQRDPTYQATAGLSVGF